MNPSETLLLHAALGSGYKTPDELSDAPGWIVTTGISESYKRALRQAETAFYADQRPEMDNLKQQVSDLEERIKAMSMGQAPGRRSAPSHPMFGNHEEPLTDSKKMDTLPELKARLARLKERAGRMVTVTWRDTDVTKSSLIEILTRSKHRAMTYLDEDGARAAGYFASYARITHDATWLSMTNDTCNDVTLIRANGTGGANIHSLIGENKARFQWFTCVKGPELSKLGRRVSKQAYASAARGKTLLMKDSVSATRWDNRIFIDLLKKVYARGENDDTKVRVEYDNDDIARGWDELLYSDGTEWHTRKSEAYLKLVNTMSCDVYHLTRLASRAAITRRIVKSIDSIPVPSEAAKDFVPVVKLTLEDLQYAKAFVKKVFDWQVQCDHLDAREANAELARGASRFDQEKYAQAIEILANAIAQSEWRMVSHTAAIRLPGVTPAMLDEMVKSSPFFTELNGVDAIRMGRTTRAYALREEVEHSADEANAEFEIAMASPIEASPERTLRVFVSLQKKARREAAKGASGLPVVPLTKMSTEEIELLPAVIKHHADEVCLRGTKENPEPSQLTESCAEHSALLQPDTCNLWFRYTDPTKDKPARDWRISKGLGFAKVW